MSKSILVTFLLFTVFNHAIAQKQGFVQNPRLKISLNPNWKFFLGDPEASFFQVKTDDSNWETVHLPHTLELTTLNLDDCMDDKTQESFQRKVGWYRRTITIANSPRKIFLEFEGAHQVTTLWVNGKKVGTHEVGGYTPFHFDITNYVVKGEENLIVLLVDNRKRNDVPPDPGPFDYVKFSGLYRDVYLVEKHPIHIPFNWESLASGVTFTTPSVDPINGNATISVHTTVKNTSQSDQEVTLINRLVDQNGQVVLKLKASKKIRSASQASFNQIGGIEDDLHLWSINSPYLYRLITLIYSKDSVLDGTECKVGIRKFEHHPREGFLLNGKPIKLIGMNRHQQFPYVGDAVPNSLHRKDMVQFKELGFNVMRTAHYPQDNALIEACDELGILVYEEAPTWINIGNQAWFDHLEQAARTMVRNHRNHPSVVIWGAGINHRGYVPQMHYAIKQEDPTRLTASQSSRWTGWQTSGLTDIYGQMIYGPVEWKRHEPMLAMEGRRGFDHLAPYKLDPLLTGLIAWTAHDYYTFHPPRPNQIGRVRPSGIMSIFRHPYQETHFYPIELKDVPRLYIASKWEATADEIVVYSNTQEVELQVNGKSIGRKSPNRNGTMSGLDHPPFRFPIDQFTPGKLTAIGWTEQRAIVQQSIFTPEKPVALALKIDTSNRSFSADGSDIMLAYAHVIDQNGTLITEGSYPVEFSINGDASIIGDRKDIGANPVNTHNGIAAVLVQAGHTPGNIHLHANTKGLKSDSASFTSLPNDFGINLAAYPKFYDIETLRVDLGSRQQLVQFDWIAWNGEDGQVSKESFNAFGGMETIIRCASPNGTLRWLGEMNVMGKYGYAIGEGVLAIDEGGLALEFPLLPPGSYELTTYHHAPRSNTDSMDPNKEQLKKMNLTKVPYAKNLSASFESIHFKNKKNVKLTEGKVIPDSKYGQSTFTFESDGKHPISVWFKGQDDGQNVWLNAFSLRRKIE